MRADLEVWDEAWELTSREKIWTLGLRCTSRFKRDVMTFFALFRL